MKIKKVIHMITIALISIILHYSYAFALTYNVPDSATILSFLQTINTQDKYITVLQANSSHPVRLYITNRPAIATTDTNIIFDSQTIYTSYEYGSIFSLTQENIDVGYYGSYTQIGTDKDLIYFSNYDIKLEAGSILFQNNSSPVINISIGGIIGESSNSDISNSFSKVDVTGTEGNIGGLIGKITNGSILNSYSIGQVTGTNAKGFLSSLTGATVTNCFWNTDNVAISNGGTGLTTSQLKNQPSLVGWDFANIWGINSLKNNGYPYIKSMK